MILIGIPVAVRLELGKFSSYGQRGVYWIFKFSWRPVWGFCDSSGLQGCVVV